MSKINNSWDEILNKSRIAIRDYFKGPKSYGPSLDMFAVMNGDEIVGSVVVFYNTATDTVSKYILFSSQGELMCKSENIELLDCTLKDFSEYEGKPLEDIEKLFGKPHASFSSGFERPAYFTNNGCILVLETDIKAVNETEIMYIVSKISSYEIINVLK